MEEAPRPVYVLDGDNFTDLESFAREFIRVFCSQFSTSWYGNPDAFNDFLCWPEHPYLLVWKNAERSRKELGHGEMAKWLEERVQHCHPTNVSQFQKRLAVARTGQGPTLFDFLLEIIRDHEDFVELRLE